MIQDILAYWRTLCCLAVIGIVGFGLFLLTALRVYVYYSLGVCKSKKKMNGKTVIITGCTSGIGRETAKDLARRGAKVIMACRNVEAANKLKGKRINGYRMFFSIFIAFRKTAVTLRSQSTERNFRARMSNIFSSTSTNGSKVRGANIRK